MGGWIDPDGQPQPASAAMSKTQADWLFQRTHGQLVPYLAADERWYVYQANPVDLPQALPTILNGPGGPSGARPS